MILNVQHTTLYTYSESVKQSIQYLRMQPHHTSRQKVLSWEVELPADAIVTNDAYGNILHILTLDKPHQFIEIKVKGAVDIDLSRVELDDLILSPLVYLRTTPLTYADEKLVDYARQFLAHAQTVAALTDMMNDLLKRMPYSPGTTSVYDSAAEVFTHKQGVCQDHSHVFLACCRFMGIPARYVSGYIAVEEDGSHISTHAWVETWIDNCWHTFDISNGLTQPSHHVKIAVGLDYLDACPVRGVRFGGGVELMSATAIVQTVEG